MINEINKYFLSMTTWKETKKTTQDNKKSKNEKIKCKDK